MLRGPYHSRTAPQGQLMVSKRFWGCRVQGTVFKEAAKLAIRRLAVDPFIFVSS